MKDIQYLNISALVYIDFIDGDKNNRISKILKEPHTMNDGRKGLNLDTPELSSLKEDANPLRSFVLLDYSKNFDTGFFAAAFQDPKTKEIIFAFRGSDNDIKDYSGFSADWFRNDYPIGLGLGFLAPQLKDAEDFVFKTMNEHGSMRYATKEDMYKAIGSNSNISFTGHSLGGGIAQYMTYKTANWEDGDKGVKSVTFDAVGIGWAVDDPALTTRNTELYNSVDHVNSRDFVGHWGWQLGKTIVHADRGEYAENIDYGALSDMLYARIQYILERDQNRFITYNYVPAIQKNLKDRLKDGENSEVYKATVGAYNGYFKDLGTIGLGFDISKYHDLDKLVSPRGDDKLTIAVENERDIRSAYNKLWTLFNALQVVEISKQEGNYDSFIIRAASPDNATFQDGVVYFNSKKGYVHNNKKYTYSKMAIRYANYIIERCKHEIESKEFLKSYVTYQESIAENNRYVDPIVFDLNGNGIETKSIDESDVHFDLDSNGFAEKTSWIDSNDGLLAYDKNGDGTINNGNELFGDRTLMKDGVTFASSGFAALAEYDDNDDGVIDNKDKIYSLLRIWQDSNGDGISSPAELRQLIDVGIVSIALSSTRTNVTDSANNIQVRTSTFTRADGSSGAVGEYLLNRNPLHSIDTDTVDIPENVQSLPNIHGIGNVSSLHATIVKDKSGTLCGLVKSFISEKSASERNKLLDKILIEWAGVGAINPTSRGNNFDAQKLAVLERFFGTEFNRDPAMRATQLLRSSYRSLAETIYVMLMSQSHMKDFLGSITSKNDGLLSFDEMKKNISDVLKKDRNEGITLLGESMRILRHYELTEQTSFYDFYNYFADKSIDYMKAMDFAGRKILGETVHEGDVNTFVDDVAIDGSDNNDTLTGYNGSDVIYGGSGNDQIFGKAGNDRFIGGKGNDIIEGGSGDDVYVFRRGDGADIIIDNDGAKDVLEFGSGIKPEDIQIIRTVSAERERCIVFAIKGTEDQVTIRNYSSSKYWNEAENNVIEKIIFSNGTVWTLEDLHKKARIVKGSAGNDQLYGGDGNDTLVGGAGNDQLEGGLGNDTYVFNKGDGVDTIYDNDLTKGNIDTLAFGNDIKPEDVTIRRPTNYENQNDLVVTIAGTNDKVLIRDFFKDYYYGNDQIGNNVVEKIQFADGTTWTINDIIDRARTRVGSDGNDYMNGIDGTVDDLLYGEAGNDQLYGGDGNDTLVGGAGNDQLEGGLGNDTYVFNKGDGVDTIYDWNGEADEIRLNHKFVNVVFERVSDDLRVHMPGSLDAITISSWYRDRNYKIETFKSDNGNFITHTQIESLIQAMSSFEKDSGMTWEQAILEQPLQVQSIVSQYWTAPTA